MNKIKIAIFMLILSISAMLFSGCWNYREIDKMSIVAGVSVDKGKNQRYLLTAEIIKIGAGRDSEMLSQNISSEGETLFDAIRNIISISGKKLYWGHAQVIIFSKDIAKEGIYEVIDWYKRDAETREDVKMLISQEATAREIFRGQGVTENIKSIILANILDNQASLSKAAKLDITKYDIQYYAKGASGILPTVKLKETEGKLIPEIIGTAIIKDDKLVGFLDGDDTKYLLFIRDEIKGGLLIENSRDLQNKSLISLEIFKNKTKIIPEINGKEIKMHIKIATTVAIDEIESKENLIDEEGVKKVKKKSEKNLEKDVVMLIQKMQREYNADIFGFSMLIEQNIPNEWDKIKNNWDELFKKVKVNVKAEINIKNSGVTNKPQEGSE